MTHKDGHAVGWNTVHEESLRKSMPESMCVPAQNTS
jgi:hypothetical protein